MNRKMRIPLLFLLLAWALPAPAVAQTTFTYWEWVQTWQQLSASNHYQPSDDFDGDGIPNISEFAFGTSPEDPSSIPLWTTMSSQLLLSYSLAADPTNLIVLPQATEDLTAGQWRADRFSITSSDGGSGLINFTALDVPSGIPTQRFTRLLIALDSDGDGISDDWEVANGLSPFDDTDRGSDIDGDGDSAWQEFLQGTDPLDAASNSGQFRIPRSPRNVKIVLLPAVHAEWEDVSDNETQFRIYDATGALLGTVPTNGESFPLASSFAAGSSIGVSALNGFGESAPTTGTTELIPGTGIGGGGAIEGGDNQIRSDNEVYSALPAPSIETVRIDKNSVRVSWECQPFTDTQLSISALSIRIMRQSQNSEWTQVFTTQFLDNQSGEVADAAPAGKTWRYSAVVVIDLPPPYGAIGSDGAEIKADDYVKSLYGMRMRRGSSAVYYPEAAPGFNLTGAEDKRDNYEESALSPNGQDGPSFIGTSPAPPNFAPAPVNFFAFGKRYFTATDGDTVFAYEGYVLRGKPFTISAKAVTKITGNDHGVTLDLRTAPSRQSTPTLYERARDLTKMTTEYSLPATTIHNPTVVVRGEPTLGFDAVTHFASQTLRSDGAAMRTVYFDRSAPTNTAFSYQKTGPFEIEAFGESEVQITPDPTNVGEGQIDLPLGDEEGRTVKVRVLPPKAILLELYKVIYLDDTSPTPPLKAFEGPEPPNAADLEAYLNEIFLAQAGVRFSVSRAPDIIILSSHLPISSYTADTQQPIFKPGFAGVQLALWGPYNPNLPPTTPDLALYFVPALEPGTFGQAFSTPGRAALIAPNNKMNAVCAHELGHCFGLAHAWLDEGTSGLPHIPDKSGLRLMGYGGGMLLRYKETKTVNDWRAATTTQPTQ